MQQNGALGAATGNAGTVVDTGASLQLDGTNTPLNVSTETLTLNGPGSNNGGALENYLDNGVVANTYSSNVVLASSSLIGVDGTTELNLSGIVQDSTPEPSTAPQITKVGTGTLVLSNANTYTSGTLIDGGVVNVQNSDGLGADNETQTVTVSPPTTSFQLTFVNPITSISQKTVAISGTAASNGGLNAADSVQNALQALSNMPANSVTVTGVPGGPYQVTFVGALAGTAPILMTATGVGGPTPMVSLTTPAGVVSDVQVVNLTGPVTGTFTLTYTNPASGISATTPVAGMPGALRNNATAAQVQAALLTLPNIGALPISVTGNSGGPYTITFTDGGTQLLLTATENAGTINVVKLVDGSHATVINPTAVQTVTIADAIVPFTLTFGTPPTPPADTTGPLTLTGVPAADAAAIQTALNALPSISGANASVTVYANSADNVFTVVFAGELAQSALPQLNVSGTASGNTTAVVGSPGTLQLQGGVTVATQSLVLNGSGNTGTNGALENVSGANTLATPVTLETNSVIGVDAAGAANALTITGSITDVNPVNGVSRSFTMTKVGPGTLTYASSTNNTYTGLTSVNAGTLQLNSTATAVAGNLTIGTGTAAAGSDVVTELQSSNIASSATVTIASDGLYTLGSATTNPTQTIAALSMTGGAVNLIGTSALTLTGNATLSANTVPATAVPATISGGTLVLAPTAAGSGTTFTVSGPSNNPPEAIISSVISGGNTGGLIKKGGGTLQLTGSSTYTGPTVIDNGIVQVDGSLNAGTGAVTLAGGILSGSGSVGLVTGASGTIAPVDGLLTPKMLTINTSGATETLNPTTALSVTLTPANGNSLLAVNGNLNLNNIELTGSVGLGVSIGTSFTIVTTTGTLTGTFTNASGTAIVSGGSVFIGGQEFSVTYNTGPVGSVVLKAELGTGNVTVTALVNATSTNTTYYGEDFQLMVVVAPVVGGVNIQAGDTVTLSGSLINQTVTLSAGTGGTATATIDPQINLGQALVPGNYTVLATFNGDANYNSGTNSSLSLGVTQNQTTTNVSFSPSSNPPFGTAAMVTATVVPNTQGTGLYSIVPDYGTAQSGKVTLLKNGTPIAGASNLTLINGSVSFALGTLAIGSYSFTAQYDSSNSDPNYAPSTGSNTLIVSKDNVAVSITPPSSLPFFSTPLGTSIPFVVTVSPSSSNPPAAPTGTVTFTYGPLTLGMATLNGVSGSDTAMFNYTPNNPASTPQLPVGNDTITATYSGDANYFSTSVTTTVTVKPGSAMAALTFATTTTASPATSAVFGQQVTFTTTVSGIVASGTPTGTVSFFVNANTTPLVSVTGTTTATLTGGMATFILKSLPTGTDAITVVYSGDSNFNAIPLGSPAMPTATITVNQDQSTAAVSSSSVSSVIGQAVTLTANVGAAIPGSGMPSGTVNFYDNGSTTPLNPSPLTLNGSGAATYTTTALPLGTDNITVQYSGDSNFSGVTSAILGQVVSKANTGTVVTASANPAAFGNPVAFTATVTAASPGSGFPTSGDIVTFKDGSTVLGTANLNGLGVATFSPSSTLAFGNHNIIATFAGDANYNTSTSTALSFTVTQAVAAGSVSSTSNPSPFGRSVTLQATVTDASPGSTGTPTGTVTFFDGSTAISGAIALSAGTASFSTSTLNAGTHNITVSYSGDNNFTSFATSSPILVQTVTQDATSTALTALPSPAGINQSVTLTATVTDSVSGVTPAGSVTFKNGATTLGTGTLNSSGVATLAVSFSTRGVQSLTAVFGATTNFGTSTGAASETVLSASPVTVGSSSSTTQFGQPVTLTATVAPLPAGGATPTGSVTFYVGSIVPADIITGGSNIALVNGVATFSNVTSLNFGANSIFALYSGDSTYGGSSNTTAFIQTVTQDSTTTTVVAAPTTGATFGSSVKFTATVANNISGSPTPTGGTVTFTDGALTLGSAMTLTNGTASVTTSALPVGAARRSPRPTAAPPTSAAAQGRSRITPWPQT